MPSSLSLAVSAVGAAGATVLALVLWVKWTLPKPDESKVSTLRSRLHHKFKASEQLPSYDVIVIGSGMSGLTTAAILSRLGKRCLVLEAHPDVAGGGTHMFEMQHGKNRYVFDSGLHYTVPWSVPLLALTTGKAAESCTPFDLMGEADGTVDKIWCVNTENGTPLPGMAPFKMMRGEKHLPALYQLFPSEKAAIDRYLAVSSRSMLFVQVFLVARLMPKWLQRRYWALCGWLRLESYCGVNVTAKELLPSLTSNKPLVSLLSSMWIDTGARPDRASFMMTASVFRGIAMEGGCYPRGGSSSMAEELVATIESHGGRVLVRCTVKEILVDEDYDGEQVVVGVCAVSAAAGGAATREVLIPTSTVVSSIGYVNTFTKLVPSKVTERLGIPRAIAQVPQSAGFVMANIGIDAPPSQLGITNSNTWHIPVDKFGDHYPSLDNFFSNPDQCSSLETPAFITFPSVKDCKGHGKDASTTSCQILLMANYEWFERFKADIDGETDKRAEGYAALKKKWADKAVELLLRYYPLCSGHVDLVDISTPLSIEQFLSAHRGGAVGIDVTPERFCNSEVRDRLDVVTPIGGLFLSGQDVGMLGVTLCQLTGVLTAFRVSGLASSIKIVAASVFKGWGLL